METPLEELAVFVTENPVTSEMCTRNACVSSIVFTYAAVPSGYSMILPLPKPSACFTGGAVKFLPFRLLKISSKRRDHASNGSSRRLCSRQLRQHLGFPERL